MGNKTDYLDIIDGKIYSSYSDYLDDSFPKENNSSEKGKAVTIKELDNSNEISFELDEGDIRITDVDKFDLSDVNNNEYAIVLYPDKMGALYGPGRKRICTSKKDIYHTVEYEVDFSKEVLLYGKEIKTLSADKGKLFFHAWDVCYEKEKVEVLAHIVKLNKVMLLFWLLLVKRIRT